MAPLLLLPRNEEAQRIQHIWKQNVVQAFLDLRDDFSDLQNTLRATGTLDKLSPPDFHDIYQKNLQDWDATFGYPSTSAHDADLQSNSALNEVLHQGWAAVIDSPPTVPLVKSLIARTALMILCWSHAAQEASRSHGNTLPPDSHIALLKVAVVHGAAKLGDFRLQMQEYLGIGHVDEAMEEAIMSQLNKQMTGGQTELVIALSPATASFFDYDSDSEHDILADIQADMAEEGAMAIARARQDPNVDMEVVAAREANLAQALAVVDSSRQAALRAATQMSAVPSDVEGRIERGEMRYNDGSEGAVNHLTELRRHITQLMSMIGPPTVGTLRRADGCTCGRCVVAQ